MVTTTAMHARTRLLPTTLIGAGLTGSCLIAITSYRLGATKQRLVHDRVTHLLRAVLHPHPDTMVRLVYSFGLVLLAGAFLVVGRLLFRQHPPLTWKSIRLCTVAWSVPLLACAPIASRDVWAYAAQGALYLHGHDPYTVSPAHAPSDYSNQVSPHWRHTPAPYGPVFMGLARLVVSASGQHTFTAVMLLRVVSAIGLLLAILVLPSLCRRFAARLDVAMWLFAASPLMLIGVLGGAHNDLLMVGLMALALWLATNEGSWLRTLVPSAAMITLAAEVKAPAVLLLAFLPLIWFAFAPGAELIQGQSLVRLKAFGLTIVSAIVSVAVITAATGLSFGWAKQLNVAESGTPVLSVPKGVVLIAKFLRGDRLRDLHAIGTHAQPIVTTLSISLAIIVLASLWLSAWKRPPLSRAAAAMLASVLLSTTVQPWYFSWPLLLVVLVGLSARWAAFAAATSVAFAVILQPAGRSVFDLPVGFPLLLFVFGISWFVLRGHPGRIIGFIRP